MRLHERLLHRVMSYYCTTFESGAPLHDMSGHETAPLHERDVHRVMSAHESGLHDMRLHDMRLHDVRDGAPLHAGMTFETYDCTTFETVHHCTTRAACTCTAFEAAPLHDMRAEGHETAPLHESREREACTTFETLHCMRLHHFMSGHESGLHDMSGHDVRDAAPLHDSMSYHCTTFESHDCTTFETVHHVMSGHELHRDMRLHETAPRHDMSGHDVRDMTACTMTATGTTTTTEGAGGCAGARAGGCVGARVLINLAMTNLGRAAI